MESTEWEKLNLNGFDNSRGEESGLTWPCELKEHLNEISLTVTYEACIG